MFVEKFASNLVRGLEHAGLATLAAPSAAGLMDKNNKHKAKDAAEVAGLGTLALGVEAAHKGSFVNKFIARKLPKLAK